MIDAIKTKRCRHIRKRGIEISRDHREIYYVCPHCHHEMDNEAWLASAHMLSLQPSYPKRGCVAVTSTCPKCGESSWIHEPMEEFVEFFDVPASWKAAVKLQMHEEMRPR